MPHPTLIRSPYPGISRSPRRTSWPSSATRMAPSQYTAAVERRRSGSWSSIRGWSWNSRGSDTDPPPYRLADAGARRGPVAQRLEGHGLRRQHLGTAPSLAEGGRRPEGLAVMAAETEGHHGAAVFEIQADPVPALRPVGQEFARRRRKMPRSTVRPQKLREKFSISNRGTEVSASRRFQQGHRTGSPLAAGWRNAMGTGWAMAKAGIPGRPIPLIALALRVGKPRLARAGTRGRRVTSGRGQSLSGGRRVPASAGSD